MDRRRLFGSWFALCMGLALLVALAVISPPGATGDTAFSFIPPGTIWMYGGSTAPTGWALCQGGTVSRTGLYARLFGAIGTTYGAGDGSTTFKLPDFRGVFAKGFGSQTIGGVTYANASGTPQADKMQGHKHVLSSSPNNYWATTLAQAGANFYALYSFTDDTLNIGSPVTDGVNGTPRTGNVTEPANVGVTYIIKL